jgi:hypothetical protein
MEGRYNGVLISRRIRLRFCGVAEIQGTFRLNAGLARSRGSLNPEGKPQYGDNMFSN